MSILQQVVCWLSLCGLLMLGGMSASADTVYQWIDADGVVHFSDEAPLEADIDFASREILNSADAVDQSDDYYSITNQWERLRQERLDKEALSLERRKLRAIEKSSQDEPLVQQPTEGRTAGRFYGYRYPYAIGALGPVWGTPYPGLFPALPVTPQPPAAPVPQPIRRLR
ncbi:MAG: DUF4124 domain-containing protein [Pseudomonadota bacterium]